jgi:hypothetical protein
VRDDTVLPARMGKGIEEGSREGSNITCSHSRNCKATLESLIPSIAPIRDQPASHTASMLDAVINLRVK